MGKWLYWGKIINASTFANICTYIYSKKRWRGCFDGRNDINGETR